MCAMCSSVFMFRHPCHTNFLRVVVVESCVKSLEFKASMPLSTTTRGGYHLCPLDREAGLNEFVRDGEMPKKPSPA